MFRMILHGRFCAKCSPLPAPGSLLLTPQAKGVFIRTQSRFVGGNVNFKRRLKSRTWLYGAGVGIVLAVGLKYRSDSANSSCDDKVEIAQKTHPYANAIEVSRDLLERIKVGKETEVGAPGLIVGVAVDGVQVWSEVMRIASISKSLTTAAAARLCEEGKLDLDAPVQKYVPEFPQKQFDGKDVTITSRMILSHLSGIRHYEKDAKKVKEDKEKAKRLLRRPDSGTSKQRDDEKSLPENRGKPGGDQTSKSKESTQAQQKKEFEHEEYYIKGNYESVIKSLDLFKNDPLIFKPGTTYLYSTHAFTLLSAVLERAANQRFLDIMKNMFRELGMHSTVPDENDPIIYHRSRFYHFNKRGRVVNCPYVDVSYKWAGGGFLSTVGDLLLFGNALLYSYQVAHLKDTEGLLPGFLKPKSAIELWTPVDKTEGTWDNDGLYGQGWLVVEKLQKYGQCRKRRHYVSHTGGAVGASSVLLVLPSDEMEQHQGQTLYLPQGVVVTIITNMQSVGLNSTALNIAHQFDKARNV
ncbi:serine beta-lactamase-like protein LACTB, mitochondrial isoform X3 [Gambusia affinis]|uniref:serine beta-lactamase-like protein LACTB, mitochondrial isoform X3 n=1 Tax=Gambusia affinis TaxID=33528 RepID=UPI001CDBBBF6|nr:serine beta-lactamase-like protein LACTB, mitochondrial isoform X3 [Gambusia affinis]